MRAIAFQDSDSETQKDDSPPGNKRTWQDASQIQCKYWLRGYCKNEDDCRFFHGGKMFTCQKCGEKGHTTINCRSTGGGRQGMYKIGDWKGAKEQRSYSSDKWSSAWQTPSQSSSSAWAQWSQGREDSSSSKSQSKKDRDYERKQVWQKRHKDQKRALQKERNEASEEQYRGQKRNNEWPWYADY